MKGQLEKAISAVVAVDMKRHGRDEWKTALERGRDALYTSTSAVGGECATTCIRAHYHSNSQPCGTGAEIILRLGQSVLSACANDEGMPRVREEASQLERRGGRIDSAAREEFSWLLVMEEGGKAVDYHGWN